MWKYPGQYESRRSKNEEYLALKIYHTYSSGRVSSSQKVWEPVQASFSLLLHCGSNWLHISEIFSQHCSNLLFALFCCFSFFVCWLFLVFNLHTLPEIWISKGNLFQSLLEKDIYFDRKILNVILEFVYCIRPPHKPTKWQRYLVLAFSHQL